MNQLDMFLAQKVEYPMLYSRGTSGVILEWEVFVEGDTYYTVTGQQGGKKVKSKPTVANPKNVGRANETTAHEQAMAEAEAKWRKKIKSGGYWENINDIDKTPSFIEPMLAHPLISKRTCKKTKKTIIKDGSNKIKLHVR